MELSEKVKKGMECCTCIDDRDTCVECPYNGTYRKGTCIAALGVDNLTYIRELEARVAELDKMCDLQQENASAAIRECAEAKAWFLEQIKVYADKLAEYERPNKPLTIEEIEAEYERTVPVGIDCAYVVEFREDEYVTRCLIDRMGSVIVAAWNCEAMDLQFECDYGKTWRCWPRRPTEEERKAAEWDD